MPLVVPDTSSGDKTTEWANKLMGKKIGEAHNEGTFAKKDLPQQHRVLKKDSMVTADFVPDRLNIHVNDDGTVGKVTHG